MSVEKELQARSAVCELCASNDSLKAYPVPPTSDGSAAQNVHACVTCIDQLENPEKVDANHWRCLNDSMWSQEPAVQAVAWRMLNRLKGEGWPVDLLEMMYMEEDTLTWAKATGEGELDEDAVIHRDVNGVVLSAGDSVILIKDLHVKGSSMIAKRGTAVRNISLDRDNAEYIEGKVDKQTIVIITAYVKKS
jgi:protein PhnA